VARAPRNRPLVNATEIGALNSGYHSQQIFIVLVSYSYYRLPEVELTAAENVINARPPSEHRLSDDRATF